MALFCVKKKGSCCRCLHKVTMVTILSLTAIKIKRDGENVRLKEIVDVQKQ